MFAVAVPRRAEEAVLGVPPHRQGLALPAHPGPVHTLIDLRGKLLDLGTFVILPRGQHAAEQQPGVDR